MILSKGTVSVPSRCISSVPYLQLVLTQESGCFHTVASAQSDGAVCVCVCLTLRSGIFGERLSLRYYLTAGMLLSGFFTSLVGLGFYWSIHNIWFYVFAQAMNGLVQTTGWPAVVSCVGNWFGKGKRGLIMGVWNSHTSVGNILGSLIAGVFVSSAWGLSFIVPGIIIGVMGVICFFFLVEKPEDVNCSLPQHHCEQDPNLDSTANEEIFGSPSHSLANGSIPVEPANEEPKAISFVAALRIPCEQDPNLDSTANEEIFGSPSHSLANGSIPVEPANEEPKAISFVAALRIPGVVEFSLCLLFAKLVSYTFLYWLPLYIANVAHFDAKAAGDLSTLFDLGGIFGGILAGVVSDYTGGRATSCCVMLIAAAPMVSARTERDCDCFETGQVYECIDLLAFFFYLQLFVYNRIGEYGLGTTIGMLLLCGGLVNGPYALITTAVAADLGTHESLRGNSKALSTVTAIIDGTGSIGAALGPLLAGLISPTGWNNVFYMLITADILACLFLSRLVYKEVRGWCGFYTRMRGVNCPCKYNFPDDGKKMTPRRDVPSYPKYTLSQETIEALKKPTFDVWHWEHNEMLSCLEYMYHDLGLVKEFNMNPITLKRWLLSIQENYRSNPFHNFRHCFCVSQMMYGMIHLCNLQINARTELAVRYNDISPLENHHCAVAFQILTQPECNIFGNVDSEVFKQIRQAIITLVLATDMARHGEILDSFKQKVDNFDFTNEEHVTCLKMVLIKCCDISNEVRPTEVAEPWVDCLLEEYFMQSDREKSEGLPVAPFMDRDKVTKPTAQIGFIKFVLIPMFETVMKLFPQIEEIMVQPLRDSRDHYEELKQIDDAMTETASQLYCDPKR
ncbi:UNVERIFIED_CONTAM: hypothetical protein FKN15_055278 [Acipenser sinensis]